MGLNQTPSGERVHIGFFGLMNAGKSSLINALIGQELSLVSPVPGTTADPVRKAMELLPMGPVVLIDTAGIDDVGFLGEMRANRAKKALDETDIAVLVTEAGRDLLLAEQALVDLFRERKLPYLIVKNKTDLAKTESSEAPGTISVSALTGEGIQSLKEALGAFTRESNEKKHKLITDLLNPGDLTVLVIPIDESAPKGRLILPQQQVMRELLDAHLPFITCQPEELPQILQLCKVQPRLIITDSQKFGTVKDLVPTSILLTSFSILFARYKGSLSMLAKGAAELKNLRNGDPVLISEGCTHHRQCNDIGSVKLPGWIERFSQAKPFFTYSSGHGFPDNLKDFRMIVHCGGCMLNEAEMQSRLNNAAKAGVPIVNYGIAIAYMNGILERSLEPFPDILAEIQ